MRYYYVYKNNELFKKGFMCDIINDVPFSYFSLLRYLKWNKPFIENGNEWTFKAEERYSKGKVIKTDKVDKNKVELESIIRILEECGNTNLIRREYNKYMPYLKEHYRLDVKYYPKTRVSKKVKLIEGSKEDWIITWLDWGKNGES